MADNFTTLQVIAAIIIVTIAYLVRGITGFGSGLIAIPLLSLMLPLSIVVPLIGFLDYSCSLVHGIKLRNHISWQLILPLLPFSLLGVFLALYLFNTIDALLLKKILGIFIISYALYTLIAIKTHIHRDKLWAIPGGIFGGLIGTLFGTGGPFYVIYLQLQGLTKATFRASIATILFLDGSARIIAYFANGFYTHETLTLIAWTLPIMSIAMFMGGHIHTNISHDKMQKGIGVLLLFSGTALLIS